MEKEWSKKNVIKLLRNILNDFDNSYTWQFRRKIVNTLDKLNGEEMSK